MCISLHKDVQIIHLFLLYKFENYGFSKVIFFVMLIGSPVAETMRSLGHASFFAVYSIGKRLIRKV